ncbi:TRAP transporter substrate-binding protein DctP [Azospirillum sp.]|uniref:TRAP transporter substrate-binding protein DctP n=1 Tax=Azospirillum sp. TaxID=34012 RepID=UPI003D73ACA2
MTDLRRVLRPLLAALALCVLAAPAAAAERQIILAHAQRQDPANDPAAAMADAFKRAVEAATGGTLAVEIFPDGQLGGNRDMAGLVERGVIHSAIVTVGGVAPVYPPIAVAQIPFVIDSPEAAYAVFDGPFGRRLAEEIGRRTTLHVLGFGDAGGFFVLTNATRPIRGPEDLKGLKIRTIPGFAVLDTMIRGLGGTPVRVSSRDEFTALAAGIVDGQMNSVPVIVARRYDEVQRHVTLTNHSYAPYVWVIGKAVLAGLSAEERTVVERAARAAIEAGRATARRIEASDRGLPALERRMQVHVPTAGQRRAFQAAAQPMVTDYIAATFGAEGVSLMEAFFAAAKEAP